MIQIIRRIHIAASEIDNQKHEHMRQHDASGHKSLDRQRSLAETQQTAPYRKDKNNRDSDQNNTENILPDSDQRPLKERAEGEGLGGVSLHQRGKNADISLKYLMVHHVGPENHAAENRQAAGNPIINRLRRRQITEQSEETADRNGK